MAPIRKNARTRMRAKAAPKTSDSTAKNARLRDSAELEVGIGPDDSPFSSFGTNKKDRQRMRHSALLHRISKTAPGAQVKKRRRPSKKLAADLDGLLGALPDVPDATQAGNDEADEWEGISDDEDESSVKLPGDLGRIARVRRRKGNTTAKMEMKSIKSRPGAMKKKAQLEMAEKDRFAKNMAQMAPSIHGDGAQVQSADRWSSLRAFIGQTMQQSPLFKNPA
ncbi:ribosome biogenesis protein SLX9-domain-containing protein [Elsinoe ampelina]|uniref:Ribosome biogenesis protein SLX9 n=1 Tax=Elsinoe ampelina TaxID=302913 RepID=A0A6A6FYX7_9PEZI|nr:ribosome biogenesis protein SLX9-domain-containing protein [Elsinoe ampelina]